MGIVAVMLTWGAMAAPPTTAGDAPFTCDRKPKGEAELILELDVQRAPNLTFPIVVRNEGVTCEVTGPGRFVMPVPPTPAGATSRVELWGPSSDRETLWERVRAKNMGCGGWGLGDCNELYFVALPGEPVVLQAVPAYGYPALVWDRSIGPGDPPLYRTTPQGPSWPKKTVALAEGRGLVTLAYMYTEIVLAPRPGKTYEIVEDSPNGFATIREE